MHDVLLARPLEQAVHLAQDGRGARVGERLALTQPLGDARIVDALADHGEGIVAEPPSLEDRSEAPRRDCTGASRRTSARSALPVNGFARKPVVVWSLAFSTTGSGS